MLCLQDFVARLSRRDLELMLDEATSGPPAMVADGSRPRSQGGHFIKLAKKRISAGRSEKTRCAADVEADRKH